MKYAVFIYYEQVEDKYSDLQFDKFYNTFEDALQSVWDDYNEWEHTGGDSCGLKEWSKAYEIFELVQKRS